MQFASRVTIGAGADGGRSPVYVDAVTLETCDRLPRPGVLPVALSVHHLLRVRSCRVARSAGRFVQCAMPRNVGLNSEQTFDDEP